MVPRAVMEIWLDELALVAWFPALMPKPPELMVSPVAVVIVILPALRSLALMPAALMAAPAVIVALARTLMVTLPELPAPVLPENPLRPYCMPETNVPASSVRVTLPLPQL